MALANTNILFLVEVAQSFDTLLLACTCYLLIFVSWMDMLLSVIPVFILHFYFLHFTDLLLETCDKSV